MHTFRILRSGKTVFFRMTPTGSGDAPVSFGFAAAIGDFKMIDDFVRSIR